MEVIIDDINVNLDQFLIVNTISYENSVKLLKTKYQNNFDRFQNRFLNIAINDMKMTFDDEIANSFSELYINLWKTVDMFNYEDAFEIIDDRFRALVFSVIDVPQMINYLGSTRIKTSGIELVNKTYNETLNQFNNIEFNQVYELHKVNGEKIGINEPIYTIKCWCTSTDDEHWLWVDEESIPNMCPLEGIASTCRVYIGMIGKIKHIIRQGDVFLFEMLEEFIPKKNDEVISLNQDTYFKLLKSQS